MAVTVEAMLRFGKAVTTLDSFPLFVGYLLMVILAGLWQKFTKPVPLRPVLIVYNLLCTAISAYTLVGFVSGLSEADHVYQREPVAAVTRTFFWYHWTKRLELLDTVFMVLRHKRRQISFLHVYHHASMLILSDFALSITPYPAIAPILLLNSAVHVCLYLYYALTAIDPTSTPSWKPRLTEIQILQFYIDFGYALYGYFYHGFCVYGFLYGIVMIYLFSSFYYHAYIKVRPAKKPTATSNNNDTKTNAANGVQEVPRGKID